MQINYNWFSHNIHNYVYIPSLLNLPPTPPLPTPLDPTEHRTGFPVLYSSFSLAFYLNMW